METRICSEVNRDINQYFVRTVASSQDVSGFDSNSVYVEFDQICKSGLDTGRELIASGRVAWVRWSDVERPETPNDPWYYH